MGCTVGWGLGTETMSGWRVTWMVGMGRWVVVVWGRKVVVGGGGV
jgi:hypothetical protein